MTLPDLLARSSTCPAAASLAATLPARAIEALQPDGVTSPDPDAAPGRVSLKWHRVRPDGRGEAVLAFVPTGRPGAGTGAFDVSIRVDRPDGWSPAISIRWQAGVGPGRVVPGRADTRATVDGLFAAWFEDGAAGSPTRQPIRSLFSCPRCHPISPVRTPTVGSPP